MTGIWITNVKITYMPFKGLVFENTSSDNLNTIRAQAGDSGLESKGCGGSEAGLWHKPPRGTWAHTAIVAAEPQQGRLAVCTH